MRKIILFLITCSFAILPVSLTISCQTAVKHYFPQQDQRLEPEITNFLSNNYLLEVVDYDEGLYNFTLKQGTDNKVTPDFTSFSLKHEAHTRKPIITFDINNETKVNNFELSNNQVILKLYLAITPKLLPLPPSLYKDVEIFSYIGKTTTSTYTTGQTTLSVFDLNGEEEKWDLSFISLNLDSRVFWNYEINNDLKNFLIAEIQNNPAFEFKTAAREEDIIKDWLTGVYNASFTFNLVNITKITNINDLYQYLTALPFTFAFENLDTSKPQTNKKTFTLIVRSEGTEIYEWKISGEYLVK
ncbi:hypothetical protein [Spiroplasma chrysopicola]|nr:hypothetical protein [Spiroplasma chrysopicola]